jgi:hypothetical protein
MFDHEEDFESMMESLGSSVVCNIELNSGENLIIKGTRELPAVITITSQAEGNPRRDSRMLASVLATSLSREVMVELAQSLYMEFLLPEMVRSTQVEKATKSLSPKRKTRKDETPIDSV